MLRDTVAKDDEGDLEKSRIAGDKKGRCRMSKPKLVAPAIATACDEVNWETLIGVRDRSVDAIER
jgi:hypothetical protein